MRLPIPWLTRVDMLILEYLDGHELSTFEQSPALIATNVDRSPGYVRRRVRILADAGLVRRTDDAAGYYAITGRGRRYLGGELEEKEAEGLLAFEPTDGS